MTMRTLLATTLALTLAVPVAHAQPEAKKKAQAKAYVDAGLAAQKNGDYTAAVDFYEKAYAVVAHPVLLFNIAQAYRLGGAAPEALAHYRRYLETEPNGPHAKASRGFIRELEPIVASLEAAKRKAAQDAAAAERERIERETKAEPKEREQPETEPPADDTEDKRVMVSGPGFGGRRIAGLVIGGLGLGGVGAGIAFGLKAQRLSDELSKPGAGFDADKVADGEAADRNMKIAYAVGGALVITGVVLFVTGKPSAQSVAIAPIVDAHGAGLALGGAF
jgi:tetratricopeptide (TPR) repeat protein